MEPDRSTFLLGFFVGFVVAGGAGYILGRINVARNAMRKPDKPMNVPTRSTPREVMTTAAAAFGQCLFWAIMFVFFWAVALFILYRIVFG